MYDGEQMYWRLREDLLQSENTSLINKYLIYLYLNEAAATVVRKTKGLKTSQSITTVADQSSYTLNADFLEVYPRNERNERIITYSDGTTNYFPSWVEYEDILRQATVVSTDIPGGFSILDDDTARSNVTGTTTATGTASNEESTLTDSTASFSSTVNVGDVVHNTTASSSGVVIEVTSNTAIVTSLFDSGGDATTGWTSGDSYVIVPQGRLKLILDPPPTTAGHTITVYYVQRPGVVFSKHRTFRIQNQYIPTILREAKFLVESRSRNYEIGSYDKNLAGMGADDINYAYSNTFSKGGFRVQKGR